MIPSWPQALVPDGLVETSRATLPNGASLRLRAIQPDDARRLLALCRGLSARTLYARFFSVRRLLPEEAHSLANVDYNRRMAIVAEAGEGQESELVGVARYGPSNDGTIDVGLVVADGWQGLGLGPRLLDQILKAGEQRGIRQFHADVLTDNGRALRLLARHTTIVQRTIDSGITSLVFGRRPGGAWRNDETSAVAKGKKEKS